MERQDFGKLGLSGLVISLALLLAACHKPQAVQFPAADRPVAPIVSNSFSTEDARDRVGEAGTVMHLAGVREGMWVADIGAGEGYYTVRLSPLVGPKGRVLGEDIVPETVNHLAERVHRENLDNVAVRLGLPDDPKLPAGTFDRVFMVHMYHEVQQPYAFLWHMREGLKPDGKVVVVDADRPIRRHGTPPALLRCELAAVGLDEERIEPIGNGVYVAIFTGRRPRPDPASIRPCKDGNKDAG